MRALLANKFFFRNGGSEAVMFQERNFLLKSGWDVVDFSMQDRRNLPSAHAEYFPGNQSYHAEGGARAKLAAAVKLIHSREAVRKIGALIDDTQPDIVHCHNIYHQLTPSIIGAAKKRGVPVVLTLHDYKPACPIYTRVRDGEACSACLDNDFSNVIKYRCAEGSLGKSAILYAEATVQRLLLRSYEKVDMFIAPSRFMQESVTQKRLPKDKVTVIYNGIDCHTSLQSHDDEGYILYLGRLSSEKGVATLLDAHAGMATDTRLVVAGTGPLEEELRAKYPNAEFRGHLTGGDLEETVRNASVIVIPSEWYENCPMSVLEAMASGKPVVASDIGGIPELVAHEENGLLFTPGDTGQLQAHLTRLMGDASLRRKFGEAGRLRAENQFSVDKHNAKLINLYHSVIEQTNETVSNRSAISLNAPKE